MELIVDAITKSFSGVLALDNISLTIPSGSLTSIIGPNGSGKTTLLDALNGLITADQGNVTLNGHCLTRRSPLEIARLGVGRTFQRIRLARGLTVRDHVMVSVASESHESLIRTMAGGNGKDREAELRALSSTVLSQYGLDSKADTLVSELSFGQRKLTSIACCFARRIQLALLDEPFAGLYDEATHLVATQIRRIASAGTTVLFVEHNLEAVRALAESVALLNNGRLVLSGSTADVLSSQTLEEVYFA